MKYKCVLGVKVGDKVHPPGDVIDLTDEQAAVCLRKRAVVPAPEVAVPAEASPKSASKPTPQTPTSTTDEAAQEADKK